MERRYDLDKCRKNMATQSLNVDPPEAEACHQTLTRAKKCEAMPGGSKRLVIPERYGRFVTKGRRYHISIRTPVGGARHNANFPRDSAPDAGMEGIIIGSRTCATEHGVLC
jgi:hypothetical protein